MKFRKISAILFSAIMTASLMSGCGKVKVQPMDNSDNDDVLYTDWEDAEWIESFDIKTSSGKDINVDINIKPCYWSDYEYTATRTTIKEDVNCKIVTFERIDITDKLKEKIVKYVFKDTPVYHYEDDKIPKEILLKRIELIDDGMETGEIPTRERIAKCKELLSGAPTQYIPISDYSGDMYLGYYDDIAYMIDFSPIRRLDNTLTTSIVIKEAPELSKGEYNVKDKFKERFTEEEVRKVLGGMEELIGTNYEKYFDTAYDYTLVGAEKDKYAGLIIGMSPLVDITGEAGYARDGGMWDCHLTSYTVGGKYIYYDSVDVSKIVSIQENVRILDFNNIVECVRYAMQNNPEVAEILSKSAENGKLSIKDFTLENLVIQGNGNEMAVIPAWNINNIMYFNAIDGNFVCKTE